MATHEINFNEAYWTNIVRQPVGDTVHCYEAGHPPIGPPGIAFRATSGSMYVTTFVGGVRLLALFFQTQTCQQVLTTEVMLEITFTNPQSHVDLELYADQSGTLQTVEFWASPDQLLHTISQANPYWAAVYTAPQPSWLPSWWPPLHPVTKVRIRSGCAENDMTRVRYTDSPSWRLYLAAGSVAALLAAGVIGIRRGFWTRLGR